MTCATSGVLANLIRPSPFETLRLQGERVAPRAHYEAETVATLGAGPVVRAGSEVHRCRGARDLERDDPTNEQREDLATADLAISTGCLGYVSERTIARVVRACGERRPWMAHFVLRMYPFEPVGACLAESGYRTTCVDCLFKQRRFASPDEQALVLDTLRAARRARATGAVPDAGLARHA